MLKMRCGACGAQYDMQLEQQALMILTAGSKRASGGWRLRAPVQARPHEDRVLRESTGHSSVRGEE